MQNVYDIFVKKELMFIMPEESQRVPVSKDILVKTAVFVNLYYEDSWAQYFVYLRNIPRDISIYICSSNSALLYEAKKSSKGMDNITFLSKEN